MVMVPLPCRALFGTEVAGKVSVPEKVGFDNVILESVPEKVGLAFGAYVEDALAQ